MSIPLFFSIILLASAFAPKYVVAILALNLVAGFFLSLSQMVIALIPNATPRRRRMKTSPFVSILVPAYNEPPAVLMDTLNALSRLDYENFEILVIDNNTEDEKVWKPVQKFVDSIGDNFRFYHVDKLPGFKAGALNYVIKRISKKSEYVAVIDADYLVESNFLRIALPYFTEKHIALVQFPQKYRNCTKNNQPIADEYSHFFEIYMNMANNLDCVPSTGTVSVYRLSALEKVGGFRGEALTEDADLGLRLYGAGLRGVYVDHPVGYGFMPYDLESYRKQKWRWAFGNAQSLRKLFSLYSKMSFKSWIGFLSHLTAWHHFHFLPFAALAAFPVIMSPAIPMNDYHKQILTLAWMSVYITLATKMLLFLVTLRKKNNFISRAFKAFLVHMGMTLVYSEAWIAFLFGQKFRFERTNKFVLRRVPSLIKNTWGGFVLGIWYLIGAFTAIIWWQKPIVIMAFLVSAISLFSIYYVYWKILPTKAYSKKILAETEKKYASFLNLN